MMHLICTFIYLAGAQSFFNSSEAEQTTSAAESPVVESVENDCNCRPRSKLYVMGRDSIVDKNKVTPGAPAGGVE